MIQGLLYKIAVGSILPALKIAGIWNSKARKRVQAEKALWYNWENQLKSRRPGIKTIWVHCASLGEFELILPVLDKIRETKGDSIFLAISFYSPSGYEQRKNHKIGNAIGYMPFDTEKNAKRMIQLMKADLFVLVKYEFWIHHLREMFAEKTPVIVAGARFHSGQSYFRRLNALYRPVFEQIHCIMLQDEHSATYLNSIGFKNHGVYGDARIDRCMEIAAQQVDFPLIEQFLNGHHALIVGSSWPEDEKHWIPANEALPGNFKIIVAPHEISESHIKALESAFPDQTIRYSIADTATDLSSNRVLIIDHVGDLAKIYRYGQIAFIGGAWGKGLHNIMEPIAYHIPVIFGPNTSRFPEASDAIMHGFGFSAKNIPEIKQAFIQFSNPETQTSIKKSIEGYLKKNSQVSNSMATYILEVLDSGRSDTLGK
jgi:3-deoxy-D-manno-octulosonic-acid transferase